MTEERYAQLVQARTAVEEHDGNISKAAKELGIPRKTLDNQYKAAMAENVTLEKDKLKETRSDDAIDINYMGVRISTPEELLASCEIDFSIWEVDRIVINTWEVAGKRNLGQSKEGKWKGEKLWKTPLRQIKVTLRRKQDPQRALENLLDDIRNERSTTIKRKKIPKSKKRRLALEIAIMDPHMGLYCHTPEADHTWDLDLCEQFYLFAVEDLIEQAKHYGEIEQILWIFGNDFNHADNLQHTTTKGTAQPEAVAQHEALYRGERLAISAAELMLEHAPVQAVQIPGNHDQMSSYMMGRVLNAWFNQDGNFDMDSSSNPFKKFRWGASLLGMEHGHAISPIRMAALMANEWRWDFAETHYHEWHCGDQHRKGSNKPSVFEEQGVSVEFLPGLVAPNEWHRYKSFNFQKRAANGFIWDYDCGQTNRLTTNISKYTGQWLGKRYKTWLKKAKEGRDDPRSNL